MGLVSVVHTGLGHPGMSLVVGISGHVGRGTILAGTSWDVLGCPYAHIFLVPLGMSLV